MSTEIDQLEDIIINAVKTNIAEFRLVETWPEGTDLDGLLRNALALPACYVIWGGEKYGEKKVIGANTSDDEMTFGLTIITQNLRSPKDGSRGGYQFVKSVETLLKGYKVLPFRGFLWPISTELVDVRYGKFAYAMQFLRKA